MTIARCSTPTLVQRLCSAFDTDPAARRATALVLLAELSSAKLPMLASTAKIWGAMADLLDVCADELSEAEVERLVYFCDLAQQARTLARSISEAIYAQPSHARVMPRSWVPQRVIDTEVA